MGKDTLHKHYQKRAQVLMSTQRCSAWLAIKEMQTKTTVRCFTATGMPIVKMTDKKCG